MTDPIPDQVDALRALEARITALESREQIQALHASFVRDVADRRFSGLTAYFAPDASIDMRDHGAMHGVAAIDEHFSHMVAVPLVGASYVLTSPVVQVSGDRGSAKWTWHRFHSSAEVAGRRVRVWGVWEEGRYDCEYVRTAEGWKFASMKFRVVRPDADASVAIEHADGKSS